MFLPATREEMDSLGWDRPDVILVSGDAYIDSPFIGVALIGNVLLAAGYKTAVIAQPAVDSPDDIARLGEPRLFWGVSGGCVDSMVANRTASGKRRRSDDFTPAAINDRRPDRAVIAYSNLIRRHFKNTVPIVLGGIEASLRRIAHYDFWSNKVRRSILFDAKADCVLYGMADRSVVELAAALDQVSDFRGIRGLCHISPESPKDAIELPAFDEAAADKKAFAEMFELFYRNNDPVTARSLTQRHGDRYLIQNPPARYLSTEELDEIHKLEFEREAHPIHRSQGVVKALETIRFSIATHRGCYGECNFCSIAVHQGRMVRSRSRSSIINEARMLTRHPKFKGIINDVGGPTANMYEIECDIKVERGACNEKRCLFPSVCRKLRVNHSSQTNLLEEIRALPGVRKVFVASGLRYDMLLEDKAHFERYMRELVAYHVSGQLKLAPEHSVEGVLNLMGKPGTESLLEFKRKFDDLSREIGKKQFLTYYLIAAHPGCLMKDMRELREFAAKRLGHIPEQIQIFTPTPSTYSTLMYWTGINPFDGAPCHVERNPVARQAQKNVLTPRKPAHRGSRRRGR